MLIASIIMLLYRAGRRGARLTGRRADCAGAAAYSACGVYQAVAFAVLRYPRELSGA